MADDDLDEYVAVAFILNYLNITDGMLTDASKQARESANHAFGTMIDNGLISYRLIHADMDTKLRVLGQRLKPAHKQLISKAKRWVYTEDMSGVDTGDGRVLTFKRKVSPVALKCMARYWFLYHRHAIFAHLLTECRDAAKQAPLAPDTYYTVTRLLRQCDFKRLARLGITYALKGKGRNTLSQFSLV